MPPNGPRVWCGSSCLHCGRSHRRSDAPVVPAASTELNVPFIVENRGGRRRQCRRRGRRRRAERRLHVPDGRARRIVVQQGALSRDAVRSDRELEPVSLFARLPNVLVVNPDVPARNVAELVAYAKANPNKLNYGAIGAGATSFLSAELFKSMAGVDIQFVSYSATTLSLTDLITGRIQLVIDNLISFLPVIRDGRVRALGMSTAVRSPLLPSSPPSAKAACRDTKPHRGSWSRRLQARRRIVTQSLAAAIRRIADAPGFPCAHCRTGRGARGRHTWRKQRLSWRKKPPSGSGSSPRPACAWTDRRLRRIPQPPESPVGLFRLAA